MNETTMEVKPEEFRLTRVIFDSKKGVAVEGVRIYQYGGSPNTKDYKGFDDRIPQPEFSKLFRQKLRKYAARVEYDTNGNWLLEGAPDRDTLFNLLKIPLTKQLERIEKGITITSITKTGEGEWISVVITGTRTLHTGKTEPFKTPVISLTGNLYGWEDELIEDLEIIEHEAFQYAFKGKCGDPTLFDINGEEISEGEMPM